MRLVVDLQACQSQGSRVRGIGRYSLSLAQAMARQAGNHELIIALNASIPDSVESLRESFANFLPSKSVRTWQSIASIAEAFNGGPARSIVASELFRQAMLGMRPDFLQISSLFEGLDSDVVSLVGGPNEGLPTAVTFYDLIPLAKSEIYLEQPIVRDWYMRRVEQLKRAELLLAISTFTASEAVDLLGIERDRIINISGACDDIFKPQYLDNDLREALHKRYRIERPYIMYTGGFDSRKNILNLIRAYASLPTPLRTAHQLLIVGSPPANERLQIEKACVDCGLASFDCLLSGFVPDEDLVFLYNDCKLYAFPSLQEGFGLPALEAMSCGAVVVGSNLSSLPEVIGFEDALFNPHNLRDITSALIRGLTDENFRLAFLEHAKSQVRLFTWDRSAQLAWRGLEEAHSRQSSVIFGNSKFSTALIAAPGKAKTDAQKIKERFNVYVDSVAVLSSPNLPNAAIWYVISDYKSALQAWETLFTRAVGIALGPGLILRNLISQLLKSDEGMAMLRRIVADQGAYRVFLETGEKYIDGVTDIVRGWMHRTAVNVNEQEVPSSWPKALDESSLEDLRFIASDFALTKAIGNLAGHSKIFPKSDRIWWDVSKALNDNRRASSNFDGRLMVDISQLVVHDARSGIQRVVRNILRQLLLSREAELQILPVYFDDHCNCRYAHDFAWGFLGLNAGGRADEIVDWLPNDRFLGLDLSAHIVPFHPQEFARLRDMGVRIIFVVYDLLPILRPDCFDPNVLGVFRRWYQTIAEVSYGILCISRSVASDFVNWLDQAKPMRIRPLLVGHFHLGADPETSPSPFDKVAVDAALDPLEGRPTVLMVSTIEPRKGYAQALEAFEVLWNGGQQINLAIVGKAGWRTEALIERLRNHTELNHRLHWYEAVSDEVLHALYERSDLLLSASEGEGFGLPLIEAAQCGVPLLLRDMPVFREVAGEHAAYFNGYGSADLAKSIAGWFADKEAGLPIRHSKNLPWLTWRQSAEQLLRVIAQERWDYSIAKSGRYWFPCVDHRMQIQTGFFERNVLHAAPTAGFMVYGPYADIERGHYRLTVHGEHDAPDEDTWLDVVASAGAEVFFRGSLDAAVTKPGLLLDVDLSFNHHVKALEIRIWSSGRYGLRLIGFELQKKTSLDFEKLSVPN